MIRNDGSVWCGRSDRERNEFMEQAIRMIEELGTPEEIRAMRERQKFVAKLYKPKRIRS